MKKYFSLTFLRNAVRHYRLLVINKVSQPLVSYRLKRTDFTLDDTLLLFGAPRGGTTWVLELLRHIPGTIPCFEPFHGKLGLVPPDVNLRQLCASKKLRDTEKAVHILTQIFTLKTFNGWSCIYTWPHQLINPRFALIKTIRTVDLLPFILSKLNLKHRPVLLMRHPVPTCQSQIKAFGIDGGRGRLTTAQILQTGRMSRQQAGFLTSQKSNIAYQVTLWYLKYGRVFQQEGLGPKVVTVFYEDVLLSPQSEMKRIFKDLGVAGGDAVDIKDKRFRQASTTDFRNDLASEPIKQLTKGVNRLTSEEKLEVQAVLDHFSFTLYNVNSPVPVKGVH